MANVFEEQAKQRLLASAEFMRKAESLLQDDLVYRSVLADAVSAIKNMLQGYLLLKIAAAPQSPVTHRWQEIAASNHMPDLIQACGEAGLDLRGLAVDIKRLNNERNYRTHDDPRRLIGSGEAARAIEIAQIVQRRIKSAVQGKTDRSLPAVAAHVARAAVSGQLPHISPRSSETAHNSASESHAAARDTTLAAAASASPDAQDATGTAHTPGTAIPAASSPEGDLPSTDDSDDSDDSGFIGKPQRSLRSVLVRLLAAALLLIVGAAAGIGLMIPIASGHAPGWLAFASDLLPHSTTIASPVATATPTVGGPYIAGALVVSTPVCQTRVTSFELRNDGATSLQWAVGSPDASSATFATTSGGSGQPAQMGVLAAGTSQTIYATNTVASGLYHVVVIAQSGTIQLVVTPC